MGVPTAIHGNADLVYEALDGVAEVYHLAALPGMWMRFQE